MELEVYKKSDFYEDYISSQKEYYERENADAYFAERLAEKDKKLRHQKFKRCLAMAKYCHESAMWLEENGVNKSAAFMLRWEKRWLALADKFKEAK